MDGARLEAGLVEGEVFAHPPHPTQRRRLRQGGECRAGALIGCGDWKGPDPWRTMFFTRTKSRLPEPDEALPGRDQQWFPLADQHVVLDAPVVTDEVPDGHEVAIFGLGCFWGAEESTGSCRASGPRASATPAARRPTRRTRRSARG